MTVRRPRRLAPMWVRELDRRDLHALTGKLLRDFRGTGISPAQDWLLDRALNELAWRVYADGPARCCVCELCCPEDIWGGVSPYDDRPLDDEPPAPF